MEGMGPLEIVVAFTKSGFGIGRDNALPWVLPEDLRRFAKITAGGIVVMGYKTWQSIPEANRPLKGRLNVVVTNSPLASADTSDVVYVAEEELDSFLGSVMEPHSAKTVYVIGGESLYKKYVGVASRIHATIVERAYTCDRFFPIERFGDYRIDEWGPLLFDENERTDYRFVTYVKAGGVHGENGYLGLLKEVVDKGSERPDRTGVGTRSLFAPAALRFDISRSIPLYTTKFVGFKTVLKELLWFLRGQTDSKALEAQGVGIWRGNTTREFLDKRGLAHYREGTIGPMYGFNWRYFGAEYSGPDTNYTGKGYDQLAELVRGLKADPWSRRHMITTYNPAVVDQGVLAPCHGIVVQFYVSKVGEGLGLSCHAYIRSNDLFLGNPFNVASYAAMTCLIAKMVGMVPAELVVSFGDAHVYMNHVSQVKEQLGRVPLPFPALVVHDSVAEKSFEEVELEDFELIGYLSHPAIRAPMAV